MIPRSAMGRLDLAELLVRPGLRLRVGSVINSSGGRSQASLGGNSCLSTHRLQRTPGS